MKIMKLARQVWLLLVLTQLAVLIQCQKPASDLRTADICAGGSQVISCAAESSNHMVFIANSYHGIQNPATPKCGFTPGDCTEELTINVCKSDQNTCSLFASNNRNLNKCGNKKANYLRIEYYCVPFALVSQNTIDICSSTYINSEKGIITSPSYPVAQANKQCSAVIKAPAGKSINVWIVDQKMNVRTPDGKCDKDFIKINDITGEETTCGKERFNFYEEFCSDTIYLSYQSSDQVNNMKGFKLYYETFDTASMTGCPSVGGPTTPSAWSTKPLITPTPVELGNLQGSATYNLQICKGDPNQMILAPQYYDIYVEKFVHGTTQSGSCDSYSPTHCTVPELASCTLSEKCTFYAPRYEKLSDCGNQQALYLYIEYRFIPKNSTNLLTMKDSTDINIDANPFGVITSGGYPVWEEYASYTRKLVSLNPYKAIRFYVTDMDIEDEDPSTGDCVFAYLELNDGLINPYKWCGMTIFHENYEFTTCSNQLTLTYKTGKKDGFQDYYRGFRAYYEVVDIPDFCTNKPPPVTSASTTVYVPPTHPVTKDIFSTVLATNVLGGLEKCYFPFTYNGADQNSCVKESDSDSYWCSTTSDFDADKQKATCKRGFTDNVHFKICKQKFQKLKCPVGYLINVISAEMIVTTDGSCEPTKKQCSESATKTMSGLCNNKDVCSAFASSTRLPSCDDNIADVWMIDYNCIPDMVASEYKKEFCSSDNTLTEDSGIIQTASYPTSVKNIDCKVVYKSPGSRRRLINIYTVSTSLEFYTFGAGCSKAYYQLNGGQKVCGRAKVALVDQFCADKFELSVTVTNNQFPGARFYYETKDITDNGLCGEPETTTTVGTEPTTTALTTKPTPPIWAQLGIASPIIVQPVCVTGKTLTCPDNYVVAIQKAFYAYSYGNNCFYSKSDCVSYREVIDIHLCHGKQSCHIQYKEFDLSECGYKRSNYINVQYECIPDVAAGPKMDMCSGQVFMQKKGALASPSWPSFDADQKCVAEIKVAQDMIIKAWIYDMKLVGDDLIGDSCSDDESLAFTDGHYTQKYCGEWITKLAIETCSNKLTINLTTGPQDSSFSKRGVAVYYEEVPKPVGISCPDDMTTKPSTTKTPKTTEVKTTTAASYDGFISEPFVRTSCGQTVQMSCPANYIIIVETSVYGVKKNSQRETCSEDPNDCQANYNFVTQNCPGRQYCTIKDFKANVTNVPDCENKIADYIYIVYRCIPNANAGRPPVNVELCSSNDASATMIPSGQAVIYKSLNYPNYPEPKDTVCTRNITTVPGEFLVVYLNQLQLVNDPQNYLEISDSFGSYRYADSAKAQLVLKSASNWVAVSYKLTRADFQSSFYTGFQLYIQSWKSHFTTDSSQTTPTHPTTVSQREGFASAIYHDECCLGYTNNLTCPIDYSLIIHKEYLVNSGGRGCTHGPYECREPTDMLLNSCAFKQNCPVRLQETQLVGCGSNYADFLDYEYQCVPSKPTESAKEYVCETKESVDSIRAEHGFLKSRSYPQYELKQKCAQEITPPANKGLKFYLLDMSLHNGSCTEEYLEIDGRAFCDNQLAKLAYTSINSKPILIKYVTKGINISEVGAKFSYRGFKIYFETFDLGELTTTREPITTTFFVNKEIRDLGQTGKLTLMTFLMGIGVFLALSAVILLVYKNFGNKAQADMKIKYSNDDEDEDRGSGMNTISNPLDEVLLN